jgi:hypothetical protein
MAAPEVAVRPSPASGYGISILTISLVQKIGQIRIDEALSGYAYSPRMMNDLNANHWFLSMCSAQTPTGFVLKRKMSGMGFEGVALTATGSNTVYLQAIGEADIVLRILNLSAASELERLKQCDRCSKWLYAERSHQRFCPGGECRKAKYAESPKYKEYRKQYMRRQRKRQAAEQSKKPLQVKHNDDRP